MKTVMKTERVEVLDDAIKIDLHKSRSFKVTFTRILDSTQLIDMGEGEHLIGEAKLVELAADSYQLGEAMIEATDE